MLLDTSGLMVAMDAGAAQQPICAKAIDEERGPLLLSPFVLAELDYLVTGRLGPSRAAALLADVARGAYQLEPMSRHDIGRALSVMNRYHDLVIGLADASLVVLAERHGVGNVLTLDRRHFRTLTWGDGKPFRLLPDDA